MVFTSGNARVSAKCRCGFNSKTASPCMPGLRLLSRIFTDSAGSIRRAFTKTLIDRRDRASQLLREEFPGSGRGSHRNDTSISGGVRYAARGTPACLTSITYGLFWLIGAKYLVTEIIRAPRRSFSRDRTGTDALVVEFVFEAGECLVRCAGEANAAIALAIGHRGGDPIACVTLSGTGVDSLG